MEQILSVAQMRNSDALTIQSGVSGIELIRRAGEALYRAVPRKEPVALVCGSGNNGSDGYALAGELGKNGYRVHVFRISERSTSDGACFLDRLKAYENVTVGDPAEPVVLEGYPTIVDCIFGTGFHGEPEGRAKAAILEINRCHELGAYVMSADINSGLNGENGLGDTVVCSDLTVSLGFYQPGHFLNHALDVMKEKKNCPIGISPVGDRNYVPSMEDYARAFPERKHDANKGNYGYVALIGGSIRYSGAAKLANLAAGRAGAGVVKLAVPSSVGFAMMPYLLESTLFPLSEQEDHSFLFREEEIRELTSNTKTVTVGMGFACGPEVEKLLRFLLSELPKDRTLIVDADGLNALARFPDLDEVLKNASCRVVLTPHLMELSRLTGLDREELRNAPVDLVRSYALRWNCILLLKGPVTLVSDGVTVYFSDSGAPGMAAAGSGDVLSGVLAAVLAGTDREDPAFLTAAGAYLAGKAGELAQEKYGDISMMAGDTASMIADAIRMIRKA